MNKLYRKALTFILFFGLMVLLMCNGCSPLHKVTYHSKQINKHKAKIADILKENPQLSGEIDTFNIKKVETFTIDNTGDSINFTNEVDTAKFLSKIEELEQIIAEEMILSREYSEYSKSAEAYPVPLATNPAEIQDNYEKRIALRNKKIEILEDLLKGFEKDTVFDYRDTVSISGKEDQYLIPIDVFVIKKSNNYDIRIIPMIDSLDIYSKVEENIVIPSKKKGWWAWLTDNRTLTLIIIMIIFFVLLLFRR